MPERYSRRLAGLGVEYSGLEDKKATTPPDQATTTPTESEVYSTGIVELSEENNDMSATSPPSPDRKRPSDESPTISPPTERSPPKRPLLPYEATEIISPDREALVPQDNLPTPTRAPSLITMSPIVELDGSPHRARSTRLMNCCRWPCALYTTNLNKPRPFNKNCRTARRCY